jgi:transposase
MELADYLNNLRDLVDEADKRIKERTPPQKKGVGRPPTDPGDISKILLLQAYTESPNRIAEGFLYLFREKLGIHQYFSYKTIERGYDREAVNEILDEIVIITNETVKGKETTYSFDGTGFSVLNKENYAAKRQKQNSKKNQKKTKSECVGKSHDCFPVSNTANKMGFSYSVMGVGVQYKLIAGMAISPDHSIG